MAALDASEFKRLLGQFRQVRNADFKSTQHIRPVEHAQIHTHGAAQSDGKATTNGSSSESTRRSLTSDESEPAPADAITIHVKSLKGDSYDMRVSPDELMAKLKLRLADMSSVPVDRQRLIYKGKALSDDKTLAELQLGDGSKIHLTVKTATPLRPDTPTLGATRGAPSPMQLDAHLSHTLTTTPHFWRALEIYLCRFLDRSTASEAVHGFSALYTESWKNLEMDELEKLRDETVRRDMAI